MSARFERNPAFERELQAEPQFRAGMTSITREAAKVVRSFSPRHTGYFVRHLRVRDGKIVSDDPFGHLVELGSIHNPPYAPIRRGIRAAGLRLDETPR